MARHAGDFTTESGRRAGRVRRGATPRRSRKRGGLALRDEREGRELSQAQVAKALAVLYDDGHPFPPGLLSFLEGEWCRLPRGFRAEYRQALEMCA